MRSVVACREITFTNIPKEVITLTLKPGVDLLRIRANVQNIQPAEIVRWLTQKWYWYLNKTWNYHKSQSYRIAEAVNGEIMYVHKWMTSPFAIFVTHCHMLCGYLHIFPSFRLTRALLGYFITRSTREGEGAIPQGVYISELWSRALTSYWVEFQNQNGV